MILATAILSSPLNTGTRCHANLRREKGMVFDFTLPLQCPRTWRKIEALQPRLEFWMGKLFVKLSPSRPCALPSEAIAQPQPTSFASLATSPCCLSHFLLTAQVLSSSVNCCFLKLVGFAYGPRGTKRSSSSSRPHRCAISAYCTALAKNHPHVLPGERMDDMILT